MKDLNDSEREKWVSQGFIEKLKNFFSKEKENEENSDLEQETTKGKKKKGGSKAQIKKLFLPEILTVSILNALVPNSAMLLIGGHGGGKSTLVKHLGRMFTGMHLRDMEDCVIRGHSQLTEEKMVATLNVAKLIKDGEEEVRWRTFTTSFWKILDEVNRLSPYAQNILLSMLAEGKVKYYDEVYPIDKYVLYGTLNPGGAGTFEMSAPFLDRFGIAVYISMPTTHDLSIILESRDDKLVGYDEIMQVPAILTIEQLLSIWFLVDMIKVSKKVENFIHSIVREFTLCDRIDKGNSQYLTPETGLCNGCHFDVKKAVCNKVTSILSVRVAKDLLRYSKALTWLLGLNEITIDIVKSIAPYVISHRVNYVNRDLNDAPHWGNKFTFTQNLIEIAHNRYVNREECYEIVELFANGKGTDLDLNRLKEFESSDLITKLDLIPFAQSLNVDEYRNTVQLLDKYYEQQNIDKLVELYDSLLYNITFPNRGELINKINQYLKQLTYWSREFTFRRWDIVRHTIAGMYAKFSKPLEETTKKQCTKQMRDKNLFLEVNVSGTEPNSSVIINCHGGKEAKILEKTLETNYPISKYDFSKEVDNIFTENKVLPPKVEVTLKKKEEQEKITVKNKPKKEQTEKENDEVEEAKKLLDKVFEN